MNVNNTSTPFDSFNARNLSPRQVSETFIPPVQFSSLYKRAHSLLIGPRGSGKTTLLKMLHPSALDNWNHELACEIRKSIDYTGIFVASDVTWGAQIGALGYGQISELSKNLLSVSAFSTNVFLSFIDSIESRLSNDTNHFKKVKLTKDQEGIFVLEFSSALKLPISIPSILSLKVALRKRLSDIFEIASKATFKAKEDRDNYISSHDFLHLHFLSVLGLGIELFDNLIDENDEKWALLFDELEIAPDIIVKELLKSLRSVNQKLLFKLSLSPYNKNIDELDDVFSAMSGQDYSSIPLWFPNKNESYRFSKELCISLIEKRIGQKVSIENMFGNSDFNYLDDEYTDENHSFSLMSQYGMNTDVDSYKKGSRIHKRFKELYLGDVSFKEYIDKKNIDLDNIEELSDTQNAQYIRKITPIVQARIFFRKSSNEKATSRSRKSRLIYTGAKSLLAVCEGNPRWLIGMMDSLLKQMSSAGTVNRIHQSNEIYKTTSRFEALLRTIPVNLGEQNKINGLLGLLELLGKYFYQDIVINSFSPSPNGSFTINQSTPKNVIDALGKALNAGAIIHIPEGKEIVIHELVGKRFRLSYMLCTNYKLPLVTLASKSLTTILESTNLYKKQSLVDNQLRIDLGN